MQPHGHGHQFATAPGPPPPAPSVIAICSGKGGVGKTSVALNVAAALAADGERVGLVDVDVHGPDLPLMLGMARRQPRHEWVLARAGGLGATPLEPVSVHGMQLMSTGFLVAEDQAVSWSADLVTLLLHQLLWSTAWDPLDRLVLDLPPGTSDLTQAVFRLLPTASAVVVVTPDDAAHLDCRRLVTMLRHAGVRVLGGVANMSGLTCPDCASRLEVFAPVPTQRSVWSAGVSRLGEVPLAVTGPGAPRREPVVLHSPDTAHATALRAVAHAIRDRDSGDEPGATPDGG